MSHDLVAVRMVEAFDGHDLVASAPSLDGKWLSVLLRAAALPRHRLHGRGSDDATRKTAESIMLRALPPAH
ncbi:hypothetical protein [Sphingobium yanoikuyae]|uniref:hypothetical protein n=1 Tax=Sphingobium yanoikuyae TaxID=13690 RepID=UPI0030B8B2E7